MKIIHLTILSFSFFLIITLSANAQTLTPKQQEYENNKVQIFSVEERNNLMDWFVERAKKMNLSEEQENEYSNILVFYAVKMGRIDDKDKGNSKAEILKEFDEILNKQEKEIKDILTKEQYKIHKENYGKMIKSIETRIAETDF